MDERFGDWMRDALADIDDDVLKRRWAGLEALAGVLSDEEVFELLLYSAGCGTHTGAIVQKAKGVFWEQDNAFGMQGNDLELRRLCGATLIHVFHTEPEQHLDVALACICVHFNGLPDEDCWPVLLQEAGSTLQQLSAGIRPSDLAQQSSVSTVSSSKVASRLKTLKDEGHEDVPIDDFNPILAQFTKAINLLVADQTGLHSALSVLKEENDILWWLVGGYSNDLKQSFDGMQAAVAAIVAGKELADHVIHLPGPLSVGNVLHRVLRGAVNCKVAISLESLVPELPMHWRKDLLTEASDRALRYCPLMAAISHCVAMDDDPGWSTSFAKKFPHSTTLKVLPESIAYQMYCERLLALNLS